MVWRSRHLHFSEDFRNPAVGHIKISLPKRLKKIAAFCNTYYKERSIVLSKCLEKAHSTFSYSSYMWAEIEDSYLRRVWHRKGLCSRLWSRQPCWLDKIIDSEHQKAGCVIQWRQGRVCVELLLLPCLTVNGHKQQIFPQKSILTSGLDILRNEGLSSSSR